MSTSICRRRGFGHFRGSDGGDEDERIIEDLLEMMSMFFLIMAIGF